MEPGRAGPCMHRGRPKEVPPPVPPCGCAESRQELPGRVPLLQSPRRRGRLGLCFARLITRSATSPEASLLLFDCVLCRRGPAAEEAQQDGGSRPEGRSPLLCPPLQESPCPPACRDVTFPQVFSSDGGFPPFPSCSRCPSCRPDPFASASGCATGPKPPLSLASPAQAGWAATARSGRKSSAEHRGGWSALVQAALRPAAAAGFRGWVRLGVVLPLRWLRDRPHGERAAPGGWGLGTPPLLLPGTSRRRRG